MNRTSDNACPACIDQGSPGPCARLRCYCGRTDCWAYDKTKGNK